HPFRWKTRAREQCTDQRALAGAVGASDANVIHARHNPALAFQKHGPWGGLVSNPDRNTVFVLLDVESRLAFFGSLVGAAQHFHVSPAFGCGPGDEVLAEHAARV